MLDGSAEMQKCNANGWKQDFPFRNSKGRVHSSRHSSPFRPSYFLSPQHIPRREWQRHQSPGHKGLKRYHITLDHVVLSYYIYIYIILYHTMMTYHIRSFFGHVLEFQQTFETLKRLPRMLYGKALMRLALSKQLRASGDQIAAAGGGFTKAIPNIQQENCSTQKRKTLPGRTFCRNLFTAK